MNYFRMQLHPDDSGQASKHASESISAGFVGLGFDEDPGDLTKVTPDKAQLSNNEHSYWEILNIQKGDFILVMSHHYPFALVQVEEGYNYIKKPVHELGIWFNHFVRIDKLATRYYSDYITNPANWTKIVAIMTLQKLVKTDTLSYAVIEEMSK